jgi:hypothetical protein
MTVWNFPTGALMSRGRCPRLGIANSRCNNDLSWKRPGCRSQRRPRALRCTEPRLQLHNVCIAGLPGHPDDAESTRWRSMPHEWARPSRRGCCASRRFAYQSRFGILIGSARSKPTSATSPRNPPHCLSLAAFEAARDDDRLRLLSTVLRHIAQRQAAGEGVA